jgi:hypothetical protein
MTIFTWIFAGIDVIAALFLLAMLLNPNQDAAGKGMIFLPVILLLLFAGAAVLLMNRKYHIAALVVSAVPAIIAVYMLYLTLKK